MSFSLQRSAHLYEPNLAKFSRGNLAKFPFREGFGHFSLGLIGAFYCLFKAGASALKWFLLEPSIYVDSHIAIASISHTGEDLCSLNPTPPLRAYTV